MRRAFLTTILAAFLLLGIYSCENNEEKIENKENTLSISDFTHSNCKPNTKSLFGKEYLELEAEDKFLKVKHINATFNCCPSKLLVNSKISNDTITINEDEKDGVCNCICTYDLDYKIGTLEYGKYHIILNKMNSVFYEFDLDFNSETNEVVNINKPY